MTEAGRRGLAGLLLLGALAALPGCRWRVPFGESLFFSEAASGLPPAADCERCHQEVVREWEGSAHARAWTSESFARATRGGQAEPCSGCHAPAPLSDGEPPRLRAQHRDEGVTCVTCHMATGEAASLTMRGPVSRSSPVEVHPVIVEDATYRSSELCGGCHRAAYEEWTAASDPPDGKRTCQGCHMPAVRRKVESVHDEVPYSAMLVALGREDDLRRHLFAIPEDAERDLGLEAHWQSGQAGALQVTVRNGLPHALPTGRFGRREVRLLVAWNGGRHEEVLAAQPSDPLPSGQARTLTLALPPEARLGGASAVLRRFDHAVGDWRELVRTAVPR